MASLCRRPGLHFERMLQARLLGLSAPGPRFIVHAASSAIEEEELGSLQPVIAAVAHLDSRRGGEKRKGP